MQTANERSLAGNGGKTQVEQPGSWMIADGTESGAEGRIRPMR